MKANIEVRKDKTKNGYPVVVKFRYNTRAIAINTGYYIDDLSCFVEGSSENFLRKKVPDYKHKNLRLEKILIEINRYIEDYHLKANKDTELENKIKEIVKGEPEKKNIKNFLYYLDEFVSLKNNLGTKSIYNDTRKKIENFDRDCTFETIDRRWLIKFEQYCAQTMMINAYAIHLRNIRAIFNYAIDENITNLYPFRKFKIKHEETRKRSLTLNQLRELINYPCKDFEIRYRDIFLLMFYLIGINAVDLFNLSDINPEGRIEYYRAKTHKLYSIKVEPEALKIINQCAGKKYLLNIIETYNDYHNFIHRQALVLKNFSKEETIKGKKKTNYLFPNISSYWARHTWATIAAELDIPKETISAALGHNIGSSVTSIYINFDKKKIDNANRKVINYVLGY